jgi:hypothetical protein
MIVLRRFHSHQAVSMIAEEIAEPLGKLGRLYLTNQRFNEQNPISRNGRRRANPGQYRS